MAIKKLITGIVTLVALVFQAGAQTSESAIMVFCPRTAPWSIFFTEGVTNCPRMFPPINLRTPGYTDASGRVHAPAAGYIPPSYTNCEYITITRPYITKQFVVNRRLELVDAIECIPFFRGSWGNWMVRNGLSVIDALRSSGPTGYEIYATWHQEGEPITSAVSACDLEFDLYESKLSDTTLIGTVPEWTCPCPTKGEQCPGGLWGGIFATDPNLWGTIYAVGNIYPEKWQYITYMQNITFVLPHNDPCPLGNVTLTNDVLPFLRRSIPDRTLNIWKSDKELPDSSTYLWTSGQSGLYGGLDHGCVILSTAPREPQVAIFGPPEGFITPNLPSIPGLPLPDAKQLLALAAASGMAVTDVRNTTDILTLGVASWNAELQPLFMGDRIIYKLPMGNECLEVVNNPPTVADTSSYISLDASTLCVDPNNTNNVSLTLRWETKGLYNLRFIINAPSLTTLLPPAPEAIGEHTITSDLSSSGYNLNELYITLLGMDSNFVMQVQTLNIPAGAGSVSLDRVTTNVVIKPTGYDVSWIADITTDADPAYVLVQIKQDGRTIHKEYMNTPAISKTITASSTSCKPLELVITAQCNSVQNTVTIPSPIDPIIQIFGYFPDPTQPTEITADPNTQVSNPGTVLFHVINNDPGSQIAWKLQNLENQAIIDSGTFTNEHVWVTNNMRLVKLLAYADVPGTCAAKVYSAPVQIYLETPQWKLPAVAYNDITIAATNIVQYNKGLLDQYLALKSLFPIDPTDYRSTTLWYPNKETTSPITGLALFPGIVDVCLNGNNLVNSNGIGIWTNVLNNLSLRNSWYDLPLKDPNFVYVTPTGKETVSTRFDVGTISPEVVGSNVTVVCETTNALLKLQQQVDTNWVTLQSKINEGSIVFTNVDFGYFTRILGSRLNFNPSSTNLDVQVVFELNTDPCGGHVTINHAITNLVVQRATSNGFTNMTYKIPTFTTATTDIKLIGDPGIYTVYGYPVNADAPIIITETLGITSTAVPSVSGGTLSSEGPDRYMAIPDSTNMTLTITAANTNTTLKVVGPWIQNTPTTASIDVSKFTHSVAFATTNSVVTTNCPTQILIIDVIIDRYGKPPFDIPTSSPSSNDCFNFFNSTPIITR